MSSFLYTELYQESVKFFKIKINGAVWVLCPYTFFSPCKRQSKFLLKIFILSF